MREIVGVTRRGARRNAQLRERRHESLPEVVLARARERVRDCAGKRESRGVVAADVPSRPTMLICACVNPAIMSSPAARDAAAKSLWSPTTVVFMASPFDRSQS